MRIDYRWHLLSRASSCGGIKGFLDSFLARLKASIGA